MAVALAAACYFRVFFSTPLSTYADGTSFQRGAVLLYALTPEYLWQVWTGAGAAPLGVFDRLPIFLGAIAIFLAAYPPGRVLLEAFGAGKKMTPLETHLFSTAVGLQLLSLATLLLGLAGALHAPWVFATAYVVFLVVCHRRMSPWFSTTPGDTSSPDAPPRNTASSPNASWEWLGWAAAVPFLAALLLAAALPPNDFDVREYHLQAPKEWRRQGYIDFMPHNIYGNMPLGAEMHVLLAMVFAPGKLGWWWGALAGKTAMALFTPLTALALYAAGRRWFSSLAGVVAGLLYLSTPWITFVSASGLNEGVSACYWFLTFYALLLAFPSKADASKESVPKESVSKNASSNQRGLLLLAGVLAGAAVSCKYPALLFVAAPAMLGLAARAYFERRGGKRKAASSSAHVMGRLQNSLVPLSVFFLAMAVSCAPWFLKNAVLAHNPTYPLLVRVFGGKTRTAAADAQWTRAHAVPRDAQGERYPISRLRADLWRVAIGSKWQNPALAVLICLAILQLRARPGGRSAVIRVACAAGLFVIVAWWAATHRIDRFWLPALPLAALLAGAGATLRTDRLWRCVVGTIIGVSLLFNFLISHTGIMLDSRYFVALDALRADAPPPDTAQVISRVNPVHRYLNTMAPAGSKVLLVGDAQPFDLEIPVLYNTCFDASVFESLLAGRNAAQSRAALRAAGVTHVYLQWEEIARYRAPGNYGFTDFVSPRRLERLVSENVLRKSSYQPPPGWGQLYEAVR